MNFYTRSPIFGGPPVMTAPHMVRGRLGLGALGVGSCPSTCGPNSAGTDPNCIHCSPAQTGTGPYLTSPGDGSLPGGLACPFTTPDFNYIGSFADPNYPASQGGMYASAFQALGISPSQAVGCIPGYQPGWNPHLDDFMRWATGASIPQPTDNLAPVMTPNATTATISTMPGEEQATPIVFGSLASTPQNPTPGGGTLFNSTLNPPAGIPLTTAGSTVVAGPASASLLPAFGGASPCSFALFGDSSCIGPIGTTTALALAALVAAFFVFGGKH